MRELIGFVLVLVSVTACCSTPDNGPCDITADEMTDAMGTVEGEEGFDKRADFDGDGAVTSTDWSIYRRECVQ